MSALISKVMKNPPPWDNHITCIIQQIKKIVKILPCLSIQDPQANLIVETNTSDIGYGRILRQVLPNFSKEQVVKYHSRI